MKSTSDIYPWSYHKKCCYMSKTLAYQSAYCAGGQRLHVNLIGNEILGIQVSFIMTWDFSFQGKPRFSKTFLFDDSWNSHCDSQLWVFVGCSWQPSWVLAFEKSQSHRLPLLVFLFGCLLLPLTVRWCWALSEPWQRRVSAEPNNPRGFRRECTQPETGKRNCRRSGLTDDKASVLVPDTSFELVGTREEW